MLDRHTLLTMLSVLQGSILKFKEWPHKNAIWYEICDMLVKEQGQNGTTARLFTVVRHEISPREPCNEVLQMVR
jgi:hypothetical protein